MYFLACFTSYEPANRRADADAGVERGNERTAFRRPRRRSEMRCMQGFLEHLMNGTRRTRRMERHAKSGIEFEN